MFSWIQSAPSHISFVDSSEFTENRTEDCRFYCSVWSIIERFMPRTSHRIARYSARVVASLAGSPRPLIGDQILNL